MKNRKHFLLPLLCCLALCLLAACGNNDAKTTDSPAPTDTAQTADVYDTAVADKVLSSGAFSEELEEIDLDTAALVYGVDGNALTDVKAYRSAGASAEEVAVLIFTDEAAAGDAKTAIDLYIQDREESYADYLPSEVPKLQNAKLDQKGNTLLLIVANDMSAAEAVL